MKKNLMIR
jgi:hypothetical protein